MWQNWFYLLLGVSFVTCYPKLFETKNFKVGIEYDNSMPMKGGADRYRHRNNYDPFFVTITAKARPGYVITYLEVTGTIDAEGDLEFKLVRGQTGSTSMVFQLISNHSDFLSYSYLSYGIKEEEYRKVANIIVLPMPTNAGLRLQDNVCTIITLITLLCIFIL